MDVLLNILNALFSGLTDLWAVFTGLPVEIWGIAAAVFLMISAGKILGIIGEDQQAVVANIVLSALATFNLGLEDENQAMILGSVSIASAILYRLWRVALKPLYEFVIGFLPSNN